MCLVLYTSLTIAESIFPFNSRPPAISDDRILTGEMNSEASMELKLSLVNQRKEGELVKNSGKKRIRRSKMNLRLEKKLVVMYSNVQGFSGKKDSITEIAETLRSDICLLAETMSTNVKMTGAKCITAKKSIGQNVAIILRGKLSGVVPMKLYEPNDTINMLGIRIEVAKNNFQRFFTAH